MIFRVKQFMERLAVRVTRPCINDMFWFRKIWRLKLVLICFALLTLFLFSKSGGDLNTSKNFFLSRSLIDDGTVKTTVNNTSRSLFLSTKPRTMVIILTYMRSGSSLTGDLIQQSPDVFYVYEPLYTLAKLRKTETHLTYFNKPDKENTAKRYDLNARELMESMLTCNSYDIDIHTLRQYHYGGSKTTKKYLECLKISQGVMGTASCLPLFQNACANSKVSVMKTIRMSVKSLKPLMTKFPTLKVVHLIRDPRGTLRSQQTVGEFKIKDAINATVKFCSRVIDDLKASTELYKVFPGRIKTVRYEDIAEAPIKATDEIYKFIGLNMTSSIRDYIWNITSAGHPDNCVICTTRNSSIATAYKWRQKLKFDVVTMIDNVCSTVYNKLGYLPLKNVNDMKNMKISVKKPMKFTP
ncbi:carbohydrate sulfotransferase 1 [Patella vulgata]|uniref:carbohydrate sulfotransferase 1 n=1 Tax=Patella vulgata TaxID=6465 RepID=UPI00217F5ABF|nr:carbohydrate sulfotransferase 1 [Patella vulgata]